MRIKRLDGAPAAAPGRSAARHWQLQDSLHFSPRTAAIRRKSGTRPNRTARGKNLPVDRTARSGVSKPDRVPSLLWARPVASRLTTPQKDAAGRRCASFSCWLARTRNCSKASWPASTACAVSPTATSVRNWRRAFNFVPAGPIRQAAPRSAKVLLTRSGLARQHHPAFSASPSPHRRSKLDR